MPVETYPCKLTTRQTNMVLKTAFWKKLIVSETVVVTSRPGRPKHGRRSKPMVRATQLFSETPRTGNQFGPAMVLCLLASSGCITVEPANPFQTSDLGSETSQDDTHQTNTDTIQDSNGGSDTANNNDIYSDSSGDVTSNGDSCDGPSPCPNVGVCFEGVISTCVDGKWTCDMSQLNLYEANKETSCDNLDNDCDGEIDEFLFDSAASDCPQQGVCSKGLFAFCLEGIWHCDYSMVPGHETKEASCDNKDNDCDGIVDEGTFDPIPAGCKTVGVCAGKTKTLCESGKTVCDYTNVGELYENNEESCDGLDNDCDGQTDEVFVVGVTADDCTPDNPSKGPCCDSVGVCLGKVNATCAGGAWTCNYNAVSGFQAAGETTCDGKDNDCDGATDEPFDLDPKESGCATAGLCFGNVAKCIDNKWECGFENIQGYEVAETLCDGFDNDCDGLVDDNLTATSGPTTVGCSDKGVCSSGTPVVCVNGTWLCNAAALPFYEVEETLCDGLDNDCDGQVDETVAAPPGSVPNCGKLGVGVCTEESSVVCKEGEYVCDWAINPLYEDPETSCDGEDNDCDGKIDENLPTIPPDACPVAGVCSLGVDAACSNGKWTCDLLAVPEYEPLETKCDNKDNDCDGLIDEYLTKVEDSKCKQVGVCATGVKTVCVAGEWLCDYSKVTSYSGTNEFECDDLDNDCDGIADENTCVDGTICTTDAICASGFCALTLEGTSGLCTDGSQCAQLSGPSGGSAVIVPEGSPICTDNTHVSTCDSGGWSTPVLCKGDTPYCFQGKCSLCLPGQLICDGLIGKKICNSTGTAFDDAPTCKAGLVCVGSGVCVVPGEQSVSTNLIADQSNPAAAQLNQQGFVVSWSHQGTNPEQPSEIHFRQFGPDGQPAASETQVAASSGFSDAQPAVSANQTGFLVGWERSVNLPTELSGWIRPYSLLGSPTAPEISIALPKDDQFGLASQITISSFDTTHFITWVTPMSGLAGLDIFSRRFDATGTPLGNPIPLTGLAAGDQSAPASAHLPDGTTVVIWQSTSTSGSQTLAAIRLTDAGTIVGPAVVLTDATGGKASTPAVAATVDGFLLVYEFIPTGTTESTIRGRFYNTDIQPQGALLDISAKSPGDHRNPSVAGTFATGYAVVYETKGPSTNGADLVLRRFTSLGAPTAAPVNPTVDTMHDQLEPQVLAFDDGRLVIIWTHVLQTATPPTQEVRFRVIGFY